MDYFKVIFIVFTEIVDCECGCLLIVLIKCIKFLDIFLNFELNVGEILN